MTEYSRAKLYEQLDALRTTLEEAVDAGDIYEQPARAVSYYRPSHMAALGGILMERITD